jgi:uncharacterized damage-inducible protein DinB
MVTHELLQLLFKYNLWADLRSLDACNSLTPEQFTRDLGSSFGSVRDTLAHIYGAEWIWNERIQGRSPSGLPATSSFSDLASVGAKLEEMDRYYIDYVAKLTQQDLDRTIRYEGMTGGEFANPLWQSLHQLTNHGTYHRGQVVTMLRQLGVKPSSTDLIGYYREQSTQASA